MKLTLAGTLVALAVLAGLGAAAPAAVTSTHECDGLQVCVPVAGPWVVVPGRGTPRPRVEYQVSCPRGFIVGGLDAELSDPAIDVAFLGRLGSPVNPGITTSGSVVVSASYVGPAAPAASVRPHLGCIPSSGGGGRVPTSASSASVFPPGRPAERRVRTAAVRAGASRVVAACAPDERLVGAAHAVAFPGSSPPPTRVALGVRTARLLLGDRVSVSVRTSALAAARGGIVQVSAICAGGR